MTKSSTVLHRTRLPGNAAVMTAGKWHSYKPALFVKHLGYSPLEAIVLQTRENVLAFTASGHDRPRDNRRYRDPRCGSRRRTSRCWAIRRMSAPHL